VAIVGVARVSVGVARVSVDVYQSDVVGDGTSDAVDDE